MPQTPRSCFAGAPPRIVAAACATAVVLFAGHGVAAQPALIARILQAQDSRELTPQTQATLSEGAKSGDPRTRMLAVRAAGRFETPALMDLILPLLADPDAAVRRAAAVAAADGAKLFTTQAIDALLEALDQASSADWAVMAASVARITLASPDQFHRVEQALAAGLPVVETRAQAVRPGRRVVRPVDAVRIEGAARALEALTRVNGKIDRLAPDTRVRLTGVVEAAEGAAAKDLARARRLALAALRTAKAVDGPLALAAAKDPDEEVRRLAVVSAGAAAVPDTAAIAEADRRTVLTAAFKDPHFRVRIEAVRGWSRHFQAANCQPILTAAADPNTHVATAALDALGAGCTPLAPASTLLQKEAEALPATGASWHRAAHAIVALAAASPADVRTLLPRFVGHPTWQVRMYAARAAGPTSAIEALVRLGADEQDNVRQAALDELTRLKRPEALPIAYDALGRNDYQLVMTAARALAGETDKPKATTALLTALGRLTLMGKDTSRDPRAAILTRLAETGSAADAPQLTPYLSDWDLRIAELAAKTLGAWTGTAPEATARLRPVAPLDVAALDAARGKRLRITMARGGTMDLRLLPDDAPATVVRITKLAQAGYFDGLTFHRVEPTFVLQGGSPGANEFMGDARYMRDEAGLSHDRGTLGISTRGHDTGDAQIFVNLVDSPRLDHVYTVFAVIERGLDVADAVLEGDVMTRVEVVDAPRK